MDLKQILFPLLSFYPLDLKPEYQQIFLAVFGLCVALGLLAMVLIFFKKKDFILTKWLRKIKSFGLTMGILGLLLLFFTVQRIYLLGARFWFLMWLVAAIVWIADIARHLLVKIPRQKRELKEKRRLEKYLP